MKKSGFSKVLFSIFFVYLFVPFSLCANGSGTATDPFTEIGDASNVTSAGTYYFSLNGNTFTTYVDANGYVLVAIDFGDGVGSLPETTALTTASRGILPSSVLQNLGNISQIRISSTSTSAGGIDVVSSDATLIARVKNGETLKVGATDNAINKSWTGLNAVYITDDASCDKTASGLRNRIIHQCGNLNGFHWVPLAQLFPPKGYQRIKWSVGEIADGDSIRLWVYAPPTNINPVADAGNDITVVEGETVTLSGSGSDSDGTIVGYAWTDQSGTVVSTDLSFSYTFTIPGTYTYTFSVTDDDGATASDSVTVTVIANQAPVADASKTDPTTLQEGDTVRFDATESYDPDGSIASYAWYYDNNDSLINTNVVFDKDDFTQGTYSIRLEVTDNYGKTSSDTIIITVDEATAQYPCSNPHEFTTRFYGYVPGDLVAIGNSNICADVNTSDPINHHGDGICDDDQRQRNDIANIIHINKWSANPKYATTLGAIPDTQAQNLLNVSSATLNLPSGAKVRWAGLYWHGSIWNFWKGQPGLINAYGVDSGEDGQEMIRKRDKVSFKRPIDADFSEIQADETYWVNLKTKQLWGSINGVRVEGKSWGHGYGLNFGYSDEHYFEYYKKDRYEQHYQGFKDVTALLQEVENRNGSANGTYWVGNIQATVGLLSYPGVEAAWTLQVIYELPSAQSRLITVTDGYVALYANRADGGDSYAQENGCPTGSVNTGTYAYDVNFTINNILTPKTKPDFATDMTLFATESDPDNECAEDTLPEQLSITKKDGSIYIVDGNPANEPGRAGRDTCDPWRYSILKKDGTDNRDRIPNDDYPIGMTIRNYHMIGALDNDQRSTQITFKTDLDKLIIGVIGFATDLRIPEVCYDYTMFLGSMKLPSVNNRIDTTMVNYSDRIRTRLFIRSLEGNFNLEDANLSYSIQDESIIKHRIGTIQVSQSDSYDYKPIDSSNIIYEGEKSFSIRIGNGANSEIYPLESRYVAFEGQIEKAGNTFFDLVLEAKTNFGIPGIEPIPFRKAFSEFDRCDANETGNYRPAYGRFNMIEPYYTERGTLQYYNLFTKVSGSSFSYHLYLYDANQTDTILSDEINATVEVEVIRADDFERNATITCGDPEASVSEIPHKFLYFTSSSDLVEVKYESNETRVAYPSLTFRMHYYVDDNNRIITNHHCSSAAKNECHTMYWANRSELSRCQSACDTGTDDTCFQCLWNTYHHFACARDNFALRPASYVVTMEDSNESNDLNDPIQHIAAGISPPPDGYEQPQTSASHIVSGYYYRFDINATSKLDDRALPYYYQRFETDNAYIRFTWAPTVSDTSGCNDTSDHNVSIILYNGSSIIPALNQSQLSPLLQVGEYKLDIYDLEATRYDWNDNYQIHHQNTAHFEQTADCRENTNAVDPALINGKPLGRVGCVTDNALSLSSKTYFPLYLRAHPYAFDVSLLDYGARTSNDKASRTFVYRYDPGSDSNMSYNVQGIFKAVDRHSNIVSNFVGGCYAVDVNMTLGYKELNVSEQLYYDLYDYNVSGYTRQNGAFSTPTLVQRAGDFTPSMKGAIRMDLGFNFLRYYNTPKNPDYIQMQDFNLSYATAVSGIYVDMKKDHNVTGHLRLDQNVSFIYGRVMPNLYFYDDVMEDSIITPIMITAYCDLDLEGCTKRGLESITDISTLPEANITDARTNESSWWIVEKHDTSAGDGNVSLRATNGSVTPADPDVLDFSEGVATPEVENTSGHTPNIVDIDFGNETSPWLIYNPDANSIPSPFYRVRFINTGDWSTTGKLPGVGSVAADKINKKKARRLEW